MSGRMAQRTYWCDACQVPLLGRRCLACGELGRDIAAASFVPVFRPELYFLKKHLDSGNDLPLKELEVWVAANSATYFRRGRPFVRLTADGTKTASMTGPEKPTRNRRERLAVLRAANQGYIERLQFEAEQFIRETVARYDGRMILVSFSGGKDSTVASHLVMRALGRSDILHIFADTTIELPDTYQYIHDFQRRHPLTPFISSRSSLDFFKTAKSFGPPSRILRWCCTTHKTNPLAKVIRSISPEKGVLAFDGVRRAESSRRSHYSRISTDHKIAREVLARPILNWSDLEVWLYILFYDIPFNQAYRKGFRRVGCLFCPFNSDWSQRMIAERYPTQHERWQRFLREQAKRMKHPAPETFAAKGWRVRAGGRGLEHYRAALEAVPCALSDDAVSYQLLGGDIRQVRHFLRPFGPQTRINGNGVAETFLIHDHQSRETLASVEVGYADQAVRIHYLAKKNKRLLRQRIEKQLKKMQVCIHCGACAAKCSAMALTIDSNFSIDDDRCISCLSCVSHKCPAVKSLHFER